MLHRLPPRARPILRAMKKAGRAAWATWSPDVASSVKHDGTLLTSADLAAEAILLEALRLHFPEDGAVTEESGGERGNKAFWVVDPIDGTSSFVEGLGHWGPTLARFEPRAGELEVDCGSLWLPRLAEHYHVETAAPARGAWFNGGPMPPFAALHPRHTALVPSRFHSYYRLRYPGKTRCLGGTAAHLALVARGAAEFAIVAQGWSAWDTATGLALIAVLGGTARTLSTGEAVHPFRHEGEAFVAGSPEWVAKILLPGALAPLPEPK